MNKRITSLIAAAALAGTFGIAHAQGSATAVPGTTNSQLSSGAHADTPNGMTAADGHATDKKHGKAVREKAGKPTTMNSNTNPMGTGTKENNGTYQTNSTSGSSSGMSSTKGSTPAMGSTTNNSNTNPRGTGTMENNGTQPTTGGTK